MGGGYENTKIRGIDCAGSSGGHTALRLRTERTVRHAPDAAQETDDGEPFQYPGNDKDFSALKTPGSQESAYEYQSFSSRLWTE